MTESDMRKFLIINPFGIGDCLFTTPVVNALKKRYPGCFVGYWCNERVGELLKKSIGVDKIFPLSRGDIKRVYKGFKRVTALVSLIQQIKRERFDVAFDYSLDSRYGLWSKLAGIKKRIGFDYKGRGRFLTDKVSLDGYSNKHAVEYYLELLKFMDPLEPHGRSPLKVTYQLTVSKENSALAKKILAESGIKSSDTVIGIAMGGGASWGRDAIYKQWPAERFGELAHRIMKETGARVVLLGSADEKRLVEIASARNDGVDLTGKLNLEELAAVMKELKLLVCNDGGPLHMAVALGVSTVSIFGPVDEKVYGPYPPDEKHIVVKKDMPCRPCYKNFRFNGCANNRRLEDISVDDVFEKVKKIL